MSLIQQSDEGARGDLLWIPLGAGGPSVVRFSGRAFEALSAFASRRSRQDLYHSALELVVPPDRFVIEVTPVPDSNGRERGVVGEGPVGLSWLSRFRIFRYELRRWREGVIPDASEAVASPVRVTDDASQVERILELVPHVPTPVWGLDELDAGEMWNSNSVISWLLECAGIDADAIPMPPNGRAPGWASGIVVARRRS